MQKLIVLALVLLAVTGCTTKIENSYTINGDGNIIKAADTVEATPNNADLIDAAGSGSGSASANGGK